MHTTTLPSHPLSHSLGTHHHAYNRHSDQHRGTSLPGHYHERNIMAGSELSSAAPPGSEQEYDVEEEYTAQNDRPSFPVNNYSGKYTRDEILALHRLDYPVPQQFALEEDITSKSALEPVAFTKYLRKPQDGIRESQFFGLGKSTKGRGRGRRQTDEHGLNYSTPGIDPRSIQSEPPHPAADLVRHSSTHSVPNPTGSPSSIQSSHSSSGISQSGHSGVTSSSSQHYNSGYSSFHMLGEDLILDDEKWYYKDPNEVERGPFGSMQMDKWVKYDFFKVDLNVRRENTDYGYLGDIFFSEGRNPFTGEPLDRWFKGPTSEFKISLMLLIQNYHLNRMKQEPQRMEYQFNLNTNPSENPAPYHISDSQPLHKSSSTVTTELKPNMETISLNASEKHEEKKPAPWHLTSSESNYSSTSYNQPYNQNQQQKDWSTLKEEQTSTIRQIVDQMNKPKKAKKRKGKKVNTTTNQPPAKPSQNVSSPSQKKPDDVVKLTSMNSESKPNNVNTQYQNNTQKSVNQPDKNKPQSPTQPTQSRQSINKKPKPQYKIKESTPSESKPEPEASKNELVTQPSNQTQFSKRQNVRQPKVWKRKDEGVNDEHN